MSVIFPHHLFVITLETTKIIGEVKCLLDLPVLEKFLHLRKPINMFFFLVFYRPCSRPTCSGIALVDGSEFGFINLGITMVSFEILRDFMYHFLYGRYVPGLTWIALYPFLNL